MSDLTGQFNKLMSKIITNTDNADSLEFVSAHKNQQKQIST